MNVKKDTRKHIKYILVIGIGLVIIILNSSAIIEKFKPKNYMYRPPENAVSFYHKIVPPFILVNGVGDTLRLPDNHNHLMIGLNRNLYSGELYRQQLIQYLGLVKYDIDIIIVTTYKHKDVFKNKYKHIFVYNDKELGEFFHLSNFLDYSLIIKKNNQVEYFDYNVLKPHEITLLFEKFTLQYKK